LRAGSGPGGEQRQVPFTFIGMSKTGKVDVFLHGAKIAPITREEVPAEVLGDACDGDLTLCVTSCGTMELGEQEVPEYLQEQKTWLDGMVGSPAGVVHRLLTAAGVEPDWLETGTPSKNESLLFRDADIRAEGAIKGQWHRFELLFDGETLTRVKYTGAIRATVHEDAFVPGRIPLDPPDDAADIVARISKEKARLKREQRGSSAE
jgi:hypothetical protein